MRVLFVCTGNRHRSPMAQTILSTLVARRRLEAEIGSAGILEGGHPIPEETRDALEALGFGAPGLAALQSRQLSDAAIAGADLVLGLARDHVREVVVRVPESWPRAFTLKELVRLGRAVEPRREDEGLSSWLARAGQDRHRHDLLGASDLDDVADPIGGPPSVFVRTAAEIQDLCVSLGSLVWP